MISVAFIVKIDRGPQLWAGLAPPAAEPQLNGPRARPPCFLGAVFPLDSRGAREPKSRSPTTSYGGRNAPPLAAGKLGAARSWEIRHHKAPRTRFRKARAVGERIVY